MKLHKRQILGGLIGGVALGLVISQVLSSSFQIEPTSINHGVTSAIATIGALVVGGGRLTWPSKVDDKTQ